MFQSTIGIFWPSRKLSISQLWSNLGWFHNFSPSIILFSYSKELKKENELYSPREDTLTVVLSCLKHSNSSHSPGPRFKLPVMAWSGFYLQLVFSLSPSGLALNTQLCCTNVLLLAPHALCYVLPLPWFQLPGGQTHHSWFTQLLLSLGSLCCSPHLPSGTHHHPSVLP